MLKNSTNILNFKLCTIEKVLVSVFWTGDHEVGHVLGFWSHDLMRKLQKIPSAVILIVYNGVVFRCLAADL